MLLGVSGLMKILILVVFVAILFVSYVRYVENNLVFYPSSDMEFIPKDIGLSYEDIYFEAQDGVSLNGWLIKAPKAKGTLIFCHGNAGNISNRLEKIKTFYELGVNVFIFDYRGYGKSEGKPSEKGLYADAHGAYAYLLSRKDIDLKYIFAYGCSLGGAVAIDLAAKQRLFCLIVDSSFSSARDMAKIILPIAPSFLIKMKFDSVAKVKVIKIPKLFLHRKEDEVIPYRLGQKLFGEASDPKIFKENRGSHNDGYQQYKDLFVKNISSFLSELGGF